MTYVNNGVKHRWCKKNYPLFLKAWIRSMEAKVNDRLCFGYCDKCGLPLNVSRTMPKIRYMRCSDKSCKGRGKIPRTELLQSSKDSQIVLQITHLPD